MRAGALALLAWAAWPGQVAAAPPLERIAIIVGSNVGWGDDELLRFAEADARRFRDILLELGSVRPERAILLLGGGPEPILRAFNEARGRAAELNASGRRVMLLFYYSGHGDDEALHLPRGALPLAQVRSELARIPAELRISFLDACRTGGRLKGVQRGPAFALAEPAESARGTIELRASSIGEAAQESEELAGAIFTHFVLSGLRGLADLDGDRRVTVSELYTYVYRRTLFRTGSQGAAGLQHPAVMVDLSGAGEVVLSTPSSGAAALEVPAGPDRYLVFALPSAAVMGEIGGGDGRILALPAGRFLVARRTPERTAVTEVDLSWGGTRQLRDGDFRPVAREELVARGGHLELRPWRVAPRIGAEFAPGSSEGPAVRAGVMLGHNYGSLGLELETSYVSGSFSNVAVDAFGSVRGYSGWEHSMLLGPAMVVRLLRGPWSVEAALGAELRYSWQTLVNAVNAQPTRFSFASAGPLGSMRVSLSLGYHLAVTTAASFAALVRNERDGNNVQHDFVFHPVLYFAADLAYAF